MKGKCNLIEVFLYPPLRRCKKKNLETALDEERGYERSLKIVQRAISSRQIDGGEWDVYFF